MNNLLKHAFLLSLLFLPVGLMAQVSYGTLFLGGSFGLSSASSEEVLTSNGVSFTSESFESTFNITPSFGYFITDQIAILGVVGFRAFGSEVITPQNGPIPQSTETVTLNAFSIGAGARYFLPLGEKVALAGDALLEVGRGSGEREITSDGGGSFKNDLRLGAFEFGIKPSILFFPIPKISMEANLGNLLGFSSTVLTEEDAGGDEQETTEVDFNFLNVNSFTVELGFNYYFGNGGE